jgi:hypothetical protein
VVCGERDDRWDPRGGERGVRLAGSGWFGAVWAGWFPGCGPSDCWLLLLFFSFCFLFLLFQISVLGIEKTIIFRFE